LNDPKYGICFYFSGCSIKIEALAEISYLNSESYLFVSANLNIFLIIDRKWYKIEQNVSYLYSGIFNNDKLFLI